jgi:hypothetical protein
VDDVALFFHILGALAFASGIVVAGVAFEAARRRDTPAKASAGAEGGSMRRLGRNAS